jgi:hypothetical protein
MASIATSYRPLRPDDEFGLQPNPLAAQMPQPQHALALSPVTPADLNAPIQQDPGFEHFLATEAAKSRSDLSPDASPLERAAVPLADQVKSADHENPVSPFAVFGGALGASLAGRQMNTEPYDQAIDLDRKDRAAAKADAEKKAKEQLAARRQDPNSEESMTAQISMGPMLKQLGFADDEIRSLSADDIRDMGKGGNLALSMVETRSRAEQRKQAAQEAAKAREQGITDQMRVLEHNRQFDVDHPLPHSEGGGMWYAPPASVAGTEGDLLKSQIPDALPAERKAALSAAIDGLPTIANAKERERQKASIQHAIDAANAAVGANKPPKAGGADDVAKYVSSIPTTNLHIHVDNPEAAASALEISKRSLGQLQGDVKTAERAAHLHEKMLELEDEWRQGSTADKAAVLANSMAPMTPIPDSAKRLKQVYSAYDSFGTELTGIKARIAQSAGAAAEREDEKRKIPGITDQGARDALQGVGDMLETNANANLGTYGMSVHLARDARFGGHGSAQGRTGADGQPSQTQPTAPPGKVRVALPDGSAKYVPEDKVDQFLAQFKGSQVAP